MKYCYLLRKDFSKPQNIQNWEQALVSSEKIGNSLYCSSLLEKKVYEMYCELNKKFVHLDVNSKLKTIIQDTLKHSKLFEEMSKDLTKKLPSEKKCKISLGETWNHVEYMIKFLKQKKSLNEDEFLDLIQRLAVTEHHLGEEYSTLEKVKMFSYMKKEILGSYGIDFNSKKTVLQSIIRDEHEHANILLEIYEILKKSMPKQEKHPEFKYQNPDAWRSPI